MSGIEEFILSYDIQVDPFTTSDVYKVDAFGKIPENDTNEINIIFLPGASNKF